MADKDTRDEVGLDGEPLPQHDSPQTEGGPAARLDPAADPVTAPSTPEPDAPEPDGLDETAPNPAPMPDPETAPLLETAEARASVPQSSPEAIPPCGATEPVSIAPQAAVEPAAAPPAPDDRDAAPPLPTGEESPDSAQSPANASPDRTVAEAEQPDSLASQAAAAPLVEPAAIMPVEAAPIHEPWHAAIADALASPGGTDTAPSDAPPANPTPAQPENTEADTPEAAPDRNGASGPDTIVPGPITAAVTAAAATVAAPTPVALPTQPDVPPSEPSFTNAAQDLFRPPATTEEPHLITLGRRLDPALRIPRPVPPVITPPDDRSEFETLGPPRATWKTGSWKDRLRIAARYAAYAAGGYLLLVLSLIVLFRFVNPPGSMLMLTQLLGGTAIDRTWMPFASISPTLVRAVIVSEDSRFCAHSGIDTAAMKEAIERATRGTPRGASTISMQVTKNLFLWNAKSYVRKVIEIPLTLVMELIWPKRRVLEVYLNIAEWGPGIFGAEAAARHHFKKPAADLNEREAALLAAVLPNPLVRVAGAPGPQTSRKARVIQARVKAYGAVASCVVAPPPPASATPSAPAAKPKPLRKPPARPKPPAKKTNDWTPTLNFGPQ